MKFEDKYAPHSLADVVFPSVAIQNHILAIAAKASTDDLLLHGPHGTGKSTVARLIYKEWYGRLPMGTPAFTGPEMSTDAKASGHLACIRNMANFDKFFGGHGLVILDELDVVSTNAQYKLREIMQSGGRQVQFVFTTNHPQKVYTGIRSACRVIEFPNPTPKQWLPRAQHILQSEGVFLPDANVLNILAVSSGDIRQTCRLLQDTVLANLKSSAPAVPPASLTVIVTPPQQQVAPSAQPTP
jgi:replication factor C subunit 3/5